jgi:organic radical activating enzyme
LYRVKEVFPTIQGEGANTGRVAVFVRFAGCNLWDGTEAGRAKGKAPCAKWCDTDFVGGTKYTLEELTEEHLRIPSPRSVPGQPEIDTDLYAFTIESESLIEVEKIVAFFSARTRPASRRCFKRR